MSLWVTMVPKRASCRLWWPPDVECVVFQRREVLVKRRHPAIGPAYRLDEMNSLANSPCFRSDGCKTSSNPPRNTQGDGHNRQPRWYHRLYWGLVVALEPLPIASRVSTCLLSEIAVCRRQESCSPPLNLKFAVISPSSIVVPPEFPLRLPICVGALKVRPDRGSLVNAVRGSLDIFLAHRRLHPPAEQQTYNGSGEAHHAEDRQSRTERAISGMRCTCCPAEDAVRAVP